MVRTPDELKRRGCGYTTGSCAAAAAKAAAIALLSGRAPGQVRIGVPYGIEIDLDIESARVTGGTDGNNGNNGNDRPDGNASGLTAECAVRKYSGDDPDVTNGMLIFASVSKNATGDIRVSGGKGIGVATMPGLSVEIGKPAINPVPMKMIETEAAKACKESGYAGGLDIVISAPRGEEIAAKTFNGRLGVVGGISILGTSGIVEPMSEKAIVDTIYIEMRQRAASGNKHLVITPGNYGRGYMKKSMGIDAETAVKCGNHIGETLDYAAEFGFESVLLIGHAGKLVKLAAGTMNTHSKVCGIRMEIFALYAAICGADRELTLKLSECAASDSAIRLLKDSGLLPRVSEMIVSKIEEHLERRAAGRFKAAAVIFTETFGLFGKTSLADDLIKEAVEA